MYSHSKIGTFETCPQKYKFQYRDRIRGEIESIEAFLGSRVHEALEKLYRLVQNGCVPAEPDILAFYEQQWDANWNDSVRIVEPDLQPGHYRNVGRQCVQDYYRHYHPFNQGRVVALEKRVRVNLDPEGRYQIVGVIDRIDKTGDGVFEIHDYKTNRSLPSQAEKDQDRQLALYEIGLREFIGDVRDVALVWHYLRFDHEIRSRRTEQELDALRTAMIERIRQIEAATAADQFPPVESRLCNWCEYRQICPLWKHLYSIEQAPPAQPLPENGVALVNRLAEILNQRRELARQANELEAEKERVEQALIAYARANGLERVFGADREARIRRNLQWQLPTKTAQPEQYEQLVALLRQLPVWPELTELSRNKLLGLLASPEGEAVRARLGALAAQREHWSVSLRKNRAAE
jgi:putative RecB family exonuclease